jgi:hypothetical protein
MPKAGGNSGLFDLHAVTRGIVLMTTDWRDGEFGMIQYGVVKSF